MNFDLQTVTRAKETLTEKGYNATIHKCVPGLDAYKIILNFLDYPEIGCNELERQLQEELGVGVLVLVENDFVEFE